MPLHEGMHMAPAEAIFDPGEPCGKLSAIRSAMARSEQHEGWGIVKTCLPPMPAGGKPRERLLISLLVENDV